ncbi:MAG: DHH family phosphoesterase [Bacteroidota bacterium]
MENTISEKLVEEVKAKITSAGRITIIMHHNPDGDALGASQGMYLLLKKLKKDVRVIAPNAYPDFLKWMKDQHEVMIGSENKQAAINRLKETDFLMLLDFNVLNRTDWLEPEIRKLHCPVLLIDHHPNPESFPTYILSETAVSSTSELVYSFIIACGWHKHLDKDTGECLYAGIMTDTGGFSHNSSRPETFETVADLLRIGIDKDTIHASVYNNYSYDRMRFLGHALKDKMTWLPAYKTAYIVLTKEEQERFNYMAGDTEGFVNYPLSIKGTVFAAFFLEKDDYVKISFRSTGNFPANEVSARHFNGGGHVNAAGGESYLSIQETVKKFVDILSEYSEKIEKE